MWGSLMFFSADKQSMCEVAFSGFTYLMMSFFSLRPWIVKNVQNWLMSRSEGAAAAAGIAELLVGLAADTVITLAHEQFVCGS